MNGRELGLEQRRRHWSTLFVLFLYLPVALPIASALAALLLQRLLQPAGLRLPLGELLRRYSLTLLGMVFVAMLVLKAVPPVLGLLAALSAPFVHAWHVGRTPTSLRA